MYDHVKTILWDLDGTILDSFGIFADVLGTILPKHNLELPALSFMARHFHGSLQESIAAVMSRDEEDALVAAVLAEFLILQSEHYEIVEHHLLPDALRLLERAAKKGMSQIIVSNREHLDRLNGSPRSIVERSSLKNLIEITICGDDSEHRKPKPEVIADLLISGKVKPEETLVIGDQFVDGLFAKNLGTKAVLVRRDGEPLVHLEQLGDDWQSYVEIVNSLDKVAL